MKPIRTLKVSVSGVRGVIGDTLKPLLLCRFARAFATYLEGGSLAVGCDTRTSGEMVKHAVFAGLLSSGMRVVDLGVCPVPTLQFAVRRLGMRGGIAVTASHNPAEWNALKFIKASGTFLNRYEAQELLSLYHQQEFISVPARHIQSVETYGPAVEDHLEEILAVIEPPAEPRFKVVIDCCNGAGAVAAPRLLERLGCEVVEIHCRPDGHFPRPPEPLPQNLGELCRAVKEEGADIGFAQDADADRLAIVSDRGEAIGEEYTLALCAYFILSRGEKGPLVTNLSASRMIDEVAARFDCPVHRTPVGEVHVAEKIEDVKAVLGGEGNGGVIYPRVNLARDSFVAMTMVLSLMRSLNRKVSRLVDLFPSYRMVKLRYEVHPHRMARLLEELREAYRDEKVTLLDGLKIERPEGWIHIRASNTEPITRVVIEARDEETLKAYQKEITQRLPGVRQSG